MDAKLVDLIETAGVIDARRPVAALYEELAALINRYHRARPQTPVSEIAEVLNGLCCAVRDKAEMPSVSGRLPPSVSLMTKATQSSGVIGLLDIFTDIEGEWPHQPVAAEASRREVSKKRASKKGNR